MEERTDYFQSVEAMPLGKRRTSRLETKRVLKSISRQRRGFAVDWTSGSASFMKTYETKKYPKWFAKSGVKVEIQVSIRLILGNAPKESPIKDLAGMEVYYRFKKTLAKIERKETEKAEDGEITEKEEFDTGKDIVEMTEWRGSILVSSAMASTYYKLLQSIGEDKVKKVLTKLKYKQGE